MPLSYLCVVPNNIFGYHLFVTYFQTANHSQPRWRLASTTVLTAANGHSGHSGHFGHSHRQHTLIHRHVEMNTHTHAPRRLERSATRQGFSYSEIRVEERKRKQSKKVRQIFHFHFDIYGTELPHNFHSNTHTHTYPLRLSTLLVIILRIVLHLPALIQTNSYT